MKSQTREGIREVDLLAPRYKVIATWPNTYSKVGDILSPTYYVDKAIKFYKTYPHLYRELEWWEDRELSDMPEYVKQVTGDIHKVRYNEQYGKVWMETEGGRAWGIVPNVMAFFHPATKEEYDNYQKSKQ